LGWDLVDRPLFIGSDANGMAIYTHHAGKTGPPKRIDLDLHDNIIKNLALACRQAQQQISGGTREMIVKRLRNKAKMSSRGELAAVAAIATADSGV
jgi:hypothetical protein